MGPAAAPPKTDTPAAYATETDVGSRWDLALRKLTQFSNAPRHDNITPLDQALLHGWAPSTICTYRARLSTLQKFAATLPPDTPDTRVVESFLATLLPRGLAGSTVRTYLSAIKFATDLGWIDCPIPAVWWKLSPAADRLKGDPRRVWFDPTQLRTASPAVPEEFCTLAITIVALSLGLRLGEAASIRPADIALRHDPPGIWFRAEKLAPDKPNRVFRPAPPYVMGWALFLHLANPALPTGDPFIPPAILSRRFSTLFTTPGQPPLRFTASEGQRPGECIRQAASWPTLWTGAVGLPPAQQKCTLANPAPPRSDSLSPYPSPRWTLTSPLFLTPPVALTSSGQHPVRPQRQLPPLSGKSAPNADIPPAANLRNTLWGIAGRIASRPLPHRITRHNIFRVLRLLAAAHYHRLRGGHRVLIVHLFWHLLRALVNICWLLLLLIKYYPEKLESAVLDHTVAQRGLGRCGHCPIPSHIWARHITDTLIENLKNFTPGDAYAVRRPNDLTRTMISSLHRDGFLIRIPPDCSHPTHDNLSAFLRPKTSEKAAFIADLRGANLLSPNPKPTFSLPSLQSIGALLASHPPGALWGTTIDLTNFFWSLRLPNKAWGAFRIEGFLFPCPPFGWDLSPVLAQETLGHLLDTGTRTLPAHIRGQFWTFHYYDDVLILGTSAHITNHVTKRVVEHLESHNLIISPKSSLTPGQELTWLGKTIDLRARSIGNTESTNLRVLGITTLICNIPLNPKVVERMCGFLLWAAAPHKGTTLWLRGWYLMRWSSRFLPRAHNNMCRALVDLAITAISPWFARDPPAAPWASVPVFVDAASSPEGFQIGIFSPTWGCRVVRAPPQVTNQQQAELYALDAASRWAVRLGTSEITFVGDNLGVLHMAASLRPALSSAIACTTVRRILNRARWSGLRAHLLWTPSGLQPADPLSRCDRGSNTSTSDALAEVARRWSIIAATPHLCEYIGILTT